MSRLLEFAIGYALGKVVEVPFHIYVLHDLGKQKEGPLGGFLSYHFHEHHSAANKNGMLDPAYFEPWWLNSSRAKEVGTLVAGIAIISPLARTYPFFVAGASVAALQYYYSHKKSHLDPEWAWEHLPNHVLHHLSKQDQYWGVTTSLIDKLIGTAPTIT